MRKKTVITAAVIVGGILLVRHAMKPVKESGKDPHTLNLMTWSHLGAKV